MDPGMNRFPALGLEDVMPFGKFKGTKIRVLLMNDLRYMEWVCANVPGFELDKQASDKMEGSQEEDDEPGFGSEESVQGWR